MPKYLLKLNYSQESWAALTKTPSNRRDAAAGVVAQLGGTLESFYFAFGDTDAYVIADLPDNVSAAAVSMLVASTGVASASTAVLMTAEQAMEAMKKAGSIAYQPPR